MTVLGVVPITQNDSVEARPLLSRPLALLDHVAPAFSHQLHVGRPNIGDRATFYELIDGMLDRHWLTNHGELVGEFERRICEGDRREALHRHVQCHRRLGNRHSGAGDERGGDRSLVHVHCHGARPAMAADSPVFAISSQVLTVLIQNESRQLITPRTTGIVGVHIWGDACDVAAWSRIARKEKLGAFLRRGACVRVLARRPDDRNALATPRYSAFTRQSFLNAMEGGAVVTDDDDLAQRIRLMTNFGFAGRSMMCVYIGTNGKMNEASAAMGLTNLEAVDEFVAANRCNSDAYRHALAGVPGVLMRHYPPDESDATTSTSFLKSTRQRLGFRETTCWTFSRPRTYWREGIFIPAATAWSHTDRIFRTPTCCCRKPNVQCSGSCCCRTALRSRRRCGRHRRNHPLGREPGR